MRVRTLVGIVLSLAMAACGSGSTSGREVVLHTEIAADPAIEQAFETQTGWTVRLSAASVSLGALYYFDGEPAFVRRREPTLWRHLAELLGPSVAHAHPGHYASGTARGQMIEPALVELAASPTALSTGNGISGVYRSGRFVFAASEPSAPELAGDVAYLRGSAEKAGKTVHFILSASFDDVAQNASKGEVSGCSFEAAEVGDDGTVTVSVKPQVWLNLVPFDELEPGSADEPTKVARGEYAQIAFAIGVAQLSAYHFAYRPAL